MWKIVLFVAILLLIGFMSNPKKKSSEKFAFHDTESREEMQLTFQNDKVFVAKSKHNGRGVFAVRDIAEGEEVEVCPILLETVENLPAGNVLTDYVFSTGVDNERAISLGYCAIVNHDDEPNAGWKIDRALRTLTITAKKPIKKGEEIFHSYGSDYWSTRSYRE